MHHPNPKNIKKSKFILNIIGWYFTTVQGMKKLVFNKILCNEKMLAKVGVDKKYLQLWYSRPMQLAISFTSS